MIFDKEEHKELTIQMINRTNFLGNILETVLEFKKAVLEAEIKNNFEKKHDKSN